MTASGCLRMKASGVVLVQAPDQALAEKMLDQSLVAMLGIVQWLFAGSLDNLQECLHELGIELGSGATFEFTHGSVAAEGLSVWPVRCHGLIGIGDADNPGSQRYLVADQPIRVSGTVDALVVVTHQRVLLRRENPPVR